MKPGYIYEINMISGLQIAEFVLDCKVMFNDEQWLLSTDGTMVNPDHIQTIRPIKEPT